MPCALRPSPIPNFIIRVHWTMEIQMNEEYIEHELEQIVTKIYFQRVE